MLKDARCDCLLRARAGRLPKRQLIKIASRSRLTVVLVNQTSITIVLWVRYEKKKCHFDALLTYHKIKSNYRTFCLCIEIVSILKNKKNYNFTYSAFVSGVGRSPMVVSVKVDQYRLPRYLRVSVAQSPGRYGYTQSP